MGFSVTARELVLALKDEAENLTISLTNDDGDLVDATRLSVKVKRLGSTTLYLDSLTAPPSPPGTTRILHPSTGVYTFPLGDQVVIANRETACPGRLSVIWRIEAEGSTDNIVQSVEVVSDYVYDLIGRLRRQIDKARKEVADDPESPCFLGYTDGDLLEYLQGGLSIISAYQPYPTFCSLEEFPFIFQQILVESALLVGVSSQKLFAIDSDITNYSAQGAAFIINHQTPLAEHLNMISQRLDKSIPLMKLHLVNSGSVHTQIGPNSRLQVLIDAAPGGAIFRNFFVSGGG